MFFNKLTKKEQENKLAKLIKFKKEIEFNNNVNRNHPESVILIKNWKEFIKLHPKVQDNVRMQWKNYYNSVYESPIYALYSEQRIAARKNDWGRVKELADQARQMRENGHHISLTKPIGIDPWEYDYGWVKAYKDVEQAIQELNEDMNIESELEAREVWQ